jgi:cell division septation protein DedD
MRSWLCPVGLVALVAAAQPALAQQQGSVQISSAAQVVAADPERRAGQAALEPDLGVTVYQPGLRFGTLFIDVHAVRRAEHARVGRSSIGLRDLKLAGLTWTLTAGDSAATPSLSDYTFSNLFAPQVTFSGGHVAGFAKRGSITVTAGRVTALRNIFGSDPQTVGQDMGQLHVRFRPAAPIEVFARASHVRTRHTREFTYFIGRGDDAGAGVRVRPIPTLELTADAGLTRFTRRGRTEREQDVTALLGGKWSLSRGWLEINAQRFSPGYFAVLNTPYLDREGAYAAGEFQIAGPLRLFGGLDAFRSNLDPTASADAAVAFPRGVTQRAFAGARLHVGGRTFLSVRAEDGDRTARPIRRPGTEFDSDTGVMTAELQSAMKSVTGFVRYERRENVDHANSSSSYEQHTASAHVFSRVGQSLQLFGSAMLIQQDFPLGGQTFLQGGGGLQVQLPRRQLWVRSEGLFTRSDDWQTDTVVPNQLWTVGLSGQLTPRTALSFDVMFDRAPQASAAVGPWLGRSMIRLAYTMPTGSARIDSGTPIHGARRRGSGTIAGIAFADWNANGTRDASEEALNGVAFVFATTEGDADSTQVTTGPTGEFAFVNVPQGRARVGIDLAVLPVDYDPPATSSLETEVRNRTDDKLAFGLVPLGSVTGRVVQDRDGDGRDSPGDLPVDEAVLVLDDGDRSERTRGGAFRFDAVRPGAHAVALLQESLPDGALIVGEPRTDVLLERARMHAETTFLVRLEKRPEIRRVFPPRSSSAAPARDAPASAAPPAPDASIASSARKAASTPPARKTPSTPGTPSAPGAPKAPSAPETPSAPSRGAIRPARRTSVWYAIQVAATHDRARARALVTDLQRRGIDAYLAEDADGLAKVRVGSYRSRDDATRELARLLEQRLQGWIARIGE